MINANDNSRFMGRILDFIGRAYGWPEGGSAPGAPAVVRAERVDPARLARYAGYYELFENQMITLVPNRAGTGLETLVDGLSDDEYLGMDSVRFGSGERNVRIAFTRDPRGAVIGVVWRAGEGPPRERWVLQDRGQVTVDAYSPSPPPCFNEDEYSAPFSHEPRPRDRLR